jgi:hypothetical protein
MKTKRANRSVKLMIKLTSYSSFIDHAYYLETVLARKPARLQLDFVGSGEIPPDSALLIRSILLARSRRTRLVTRARSSLRGAAVLLWLLGDTRQIRDDASLYLRPAGPFETDTGRRPAWRDRHGSEADEVEESDYIRVLHFINEYLPVRELAGSPISVPVLRQFGLVNHENVDRFLAAAFRKRPAPGEKRSARPKKRLPIQPDVPAPDINERSE